mmetsp:Transcript_31959/g.56438  ORF Transcript_31959/g.56438 Transcript_31959/m.56438 type:complete len:687 (-) Transcript_31959:64-2124(-)
MAVTHWFRATLTPSRHLSWPLLVLALGQAVFFQGTGPVMCSALGALRTARGYGGFMAPVTDDDQNRERAKDDSDSGVGSKSTKPTEDDSESAADAVKDVAAGQGMRRKTPALVPNDGASTFKILQLADLHFGEDLDGTWGPEQDRKTLEAVRFVLDEERPNLVVFSGDQITGESLHRQEDREKMLARLVEPLEARDIPWATVFGNHDSCLHSGGCSIGDVVPTVNFAAGKPDADKESKTKKARDEKLDEDLEAKVHKSEKKLGDTLADHMDGIFRHWMEAKGNASNATDKAKDGAVNASATNATSDKTRRKAKVSNVTAEITKNGTKQKGNETMSKANKTDKVNATNKGAKADEDQIAPGKDPFFKASTHRFVEKPLPSRLSSNTSGQQSNSSPGPQPTNLRAQRGAATRSHSLGDRWIWHGDEAVKRQAEYMAYERQHKLSRTAADGLFRSAHGGLGNYRLKLYASKEDVAADRPSFLLWFVDTGGGSFPDAIHADQLAWLTKESEELESKYGPLPGALYAHIPLPEYSHTAPADPKSSVCSGVADDDVTALAGGLRLFPLLSHMHVGWVFAGHDHGNDWCCQLRSQTQPKPLPSFLASSEKSSAPRKSQEGVHLCYGRHSGYGGYSTPQMHLRGARVMEVDPGIARKFLLGQSSWSGVKSWVRLEDGSVGKAWSEQAPLRSPFA